MFVCADFQMKQRKTKFQAQRQKEMHCMVCSVTQHNTHNVSAYGAERVRKIFVFFFRKKFKLDA